MKKGYRCGGYSSFRQMSYPKWQLVPRVIGTDSNIIYYRVYEIAGTIDGVDIIGEITRAIRLMVLKSLDRYVSNEKLAVRIAWLSAIITTPVMTCHDARRTGADVIGLSLANFIKSLDALNQENMFYVEILIS